VIEAYNHNWNEAYSCHSHVIWCPIYRRNILAQAIETRFKDLIEQVCQEHQAPVEELEVMPDPAHLPGGHRSARSLAFTG
jgi:REP-associated tyrosine transposase